MWVDDHRTAPDSARGTDGFVVFAPWPLVVLLGAPALIDAARADTWRGLTVAPGHRCSPYDRKLHYSYPQSLERETVCRLGAIYGSYTGTCFGSKGEHCLPGRGDGNHFLDHQ